MLADSKQAERQKRGRVSKTRLSRGGTEAACQFPHPRGVVADKQRAFLGM
jgi:hypothetical protein